MALDPPSAVPSTAPALLDEEAIHGFFGLTYASYLAIPRSVLQSMPAEWQRRFVACLEEMNDAIDWLAEGTGYYVTLRDKRGRYVSDPLADYQRGRRRVAMRADATTTTKGT